MNVRHRLFSATLAGVLSALSVGAQTGDPEATASPRDLALETLLTERESKEALDEAIASARKHGVSEQAIFEARFLFYVDRRNDEAIAAMLPEVRERRKSFDLSESEIFAVEEDWLAVTEYVEALAALQNNDRNAFKKHITEAFWLSPRQATAFAPHIERLHLEEAMEKFRLDLSIALEPQTGGPAISLAEAMRGRKALILHFWSPLSRECELTLPDFVVAAKAMDAAEVAVVSVLVESHPQVVGEAAQLVSERAADAPALWLKDRANMPLSRPLRVQNLPTMVLVAPDGRILYNGHPVDATLWQRLAIAAPGLERPMAADPDQ